MWAPLSHPGHAESFAPHGEGDTPLRDVVEQLARRPYADDVFAFKSMASFLLTTAPGSGQAEGHDHVGIVYCPGAALFAVDYEEWVSPTRNPQRRAVAHRCCEAQEVVDVVDRYVLRLLLARRLREPG